MAAAGRLPQDMLGLLPFHGLSTPPRIPELRENLSRMMMSAVPSIAIGFNAQSGFAFPVPDSFRWNFGLPPDFKRDATEMYRSTRSRGYLYVRKYVRGNFIGDKSGDTKEDVAANGLRSLAGLKDRW